METTTFSNDLAKKAIGYKRIRWCWGRYEFFGTALRDGNADVFDVFLEGNALDVAKSKYLLLFTTWEVFVGFEETWIWWRNEVGLKVYAWRGNKSRAFKVQLRANLFPLANGVV